MPILYDWFSKVIGASLERKSLPQPEMTADQIPKAIINDSFMLDLKKTSISYSDDPQDRLFRAHGLIYLLDFFLLDLFKLFSFFYRSHNG